MAAEQTDRSYQVVARRYRPRDFNELVGQNHVAQALSNAIATHRIGHAYLFTGARGVGKTSTARIFAKSLNCLEGPTASPCGVCDCCEHIALGDDVDVLEIDGASNRGIDEIRQLRQNASISPSRARFKIYIIDEVHMLTREAFNALLKTLEEPPGHVKFIFCTTEVNKIPITILSRCQRFDFAGIDFEEIAKKLHQIAETEGVSGDEGVFETLARRAAGSMRDAQSLLEQLLSFAPEHIRLCDVHEMLGTADDQRIFRILQAMLQGETKSIFEEIASASEEGVDFGILIEQMIGAFRDLMAVSAGADKKLLLYCSPNRWEELKSLAGNFGIQRILAALQVLDHSHNRMRFSTQDRTLLELALVRIAHLGEMHSLAVLIEQLKSGKITVPALAGTTMKGPQRAVAAPVSGNSTSPENGIPLSLPPLEPQSVVLKPLRKDVNRELAASVPEPEEPAAPRIDLDHLNDSNAKDLWNEAVKNLPMLLASSAQAAHGVKFVKPNVLVVSFAVSKGTNVSSPKSFCEKELPKITAALQNHFGHPMHIRLELIEIEPKSEEKSAAQKRTALDPREKYKIMLELEESPLVQKMKEMFKAEVVDVKSTR